MKLTSNIFLYVHAIFLIFCIGFVIVCPDENSINNLICAISIASTSISLAELFYTKTDIDKMERRELEGLYVYVKKLQDKYMKEIKYKYNDEAQKIILMIYNIFTEEEVDRIFDKDIIDKEQLDKYLEKIRNSISNVTVRDELINFIINLNNNKAELNEITDDELEEQNKVEIKDILKKVEKKENFNLNIAKCIIIIGFTLLLVVLTVNNINEIMYGKISSVNNVLTVIAFLTVIINFIIKDKYKSKSLEKLRVDKKQIINELAEKN